MDGSGPADLEKCKLVQWGQIRLSFKSQGQNLCCISIAICLCPFILSIARDMPVVLSPSRLFSVAPLIIYIYTRICQEFISYLIRSSHPPLRHPPQTLMPALLRRITVSLSTRLVSSTIKIKQRPTKVIAPEHFNRLPYDLEREILELTTYCYPEVAPKLTQVCRRAQIWYVLDFFFFSHLPCRIYHRG